MKQHDKRFNSKDALIEHLISEYCESASADPAALRKALADEGVDYDLLTARGRRHINDLKQTHKPAPKIQPAIKKPEVKARRLWFDWVFTPKAQVAFATILVIGLTYAILQKWTPESYATGRGEQLTKRLPDDSEIKLNSESHLTLDGEFHAKNRIVQLAGEAFFSVQKAETPFIVQTKIGAVQVVGTKFNVLARENRMEVTVNEGVVQVSAAIAGRDSTVTLRQGEFTRFEQGQFPPPPDKALFSDSPGWTRNLLVFHQQPLKEVLREIERRFDVTIRLQAQKLGEQKITGLLDSEDLNKLLTKLCLLINKNYWGQDNDYTIY